MSVEKQSKSRSPQSCQLAFDPEDLHQERDTHPHAVSLLAPVHRPRIAIDGGVEFGAARQGMHDHRVRPERRKLLGADSKPRMFKTVRFVADIRVRSEAA